MDQLVGEQNAWIMTHGRRVLRTFFFEASGDYEK